MNVRHITLGGFLICLSVIFQLVPVFLSEAFIFVTILSSFPIFVLARINPRAGLAGFMVAGILIIFFNVHEGLFFLLTNGTVGLSLGALSFYMKNKFLISFGSGVILASTMCIINFVIGIPVLVVEIPVTILIEVSSLTLFAILYCLLYLYGANFLFTFLNKRYAFVGKERK